MAILQNLSVVATLSALASLASCAAEPGEPATELPESTSVVDIDRQTTSPALAMQNLNAQLESALRRVERLPFDAAAYKAASALLDSRAAFAGSVKDYAQAMNLAQSCVENCSDKSQAWLVLAETQSSLHRFDEALASLNEAEALGADTQDARDTIALARGEASATIAERRLDSATQYGGYSHWVAYAASLRALKQYPEADLAYLNAIESYRDVSPFPLAWVAFQRGVMWAEEAGDARPAQHFYEAAVRRFPSYLVANVHLAELEVEDGQVEQAIERLHGLQAAEDPEPLSRLAQYLAERDPAAANENREKAHRDYQALLDDEVLAFADHACEFYLGAGDDPNEALRLALLNLQNRKSDRAYDLAIEAALASGDPHLAEELEEELRSRSE